MAVLGASSLQINSATLGSQTGSAPIFAARGWVNFNGTGTVAIRASGNVSSITDNGTGTYTVNFTTALADANYALTGTTGNGSSDGNTWSLKLDGTMNTTSVQIKTTFSNNVGNSNVVDFVTNCVAIFR